MNSINTEAKAIGEGLNLDERIEQRNKNKKKTAMKDYTKRLQ